MKLYLFYLYSENKEDLSNISCVVCEDNIKKANDYYYCLYAFTPEKDIADIFKVTRDMNKFITKEYSISENDYDAFFGEHSDYVLEPHTYMTEAICGEVYEGRSLYLITTSTESDTVLFDQESSISFLYADELSDLMDIPLNVFKDKYQDALENKMNFSDAVRMFSSYYEDIPFLEVNIDTVMMYYKLFKLTYTERGFELLCTCGDSIKNLMRKMMKSHA